MGAMPRKDSAKPDQFADLDAFVEDEREATPEEQTPQVGGDSAGKVKLAFDPDFEVSSDVSEVSVSVAASGIHTFRTDGTPVEVEPRVAELLVQSPAVKEVN